MIVAQTYGVMKAHKAKLLRHYQSVITLWKRVCIFSAAYPLIELLFLTHADCLLSVHSRDDASILLHMLLRIRVDCRQRIERACGEPHNAVPPVQVAGLAEDLRYGEMVKLMTYLERDAKESVVCFPLLLSLILASCFAILLPVYSKSHNFNVIFGKASPSLRFGLSEDPRQQT